MHTIRYGVVRIDGIKIYFSILNVCMKFDVLSSVLMYAVKQLTMLHNPQLYCLLLILICGNFL